MARFTPWWFSSVIRVISSRFRRCSSGTSWRAWVLGHGRYKFCGAISPMKTAPCWRSSNNPGLVVRFKTVGWYWDMTHMIETYDGGGGIHWFASGFISNLYVNNGFIKVTLVISLCYGSSSQKFNDDGQIWLLLSGYLRPEVVPTKNQSPM